MERAERLAQFMERLDNPLIKRLGWMPRAHPTILSNGVMLLPLANENFSISAMAFTNDGGQSWTYSQPVPEMGLTQPTVAELSDGTLVAFFRNSTPPPRRIKRSESRDGGITWSPATKTDLPHPGAGIEAVMLDSGMLAMIYNDKEESPRDRLAVSLSPDGGQTWTHTRHLENTPGGRFDYPSLIQAADGTLHATYSYNLRTIKHVHFNEAWVKEGNP
jgi:predicted neuraminidase